MNQIRAALESMASIRAEILNYHKDGHPYWVNMIITPICYEDNTPKFFASIQRDITHQKMVSEGLELLTVVDHITGVNNRHGFDLSFNREWREAQYHDVPVSLIYLDIDNFKTINDTFGHQYDDDIIRSVARAIQDKVRSTDIVAGIGGDEFAVLLINCHLRKTVKIGDSIQCRINKLDAYNCELSISAGVGERAEHFDSIANFIEEVDQKLYQAKQSGRNRIVHGRSDR